MQTLAFNVVLMSWIGNDDLADIKTTSQIMASAFGTIITEVQTQGLQRVLKAVSFTVNDDWELRLSTEDYLHGVITLVNELVRPIFACDY